ncbi:hypothetical protein FZEAL_614 [Fusarium zealandicum]|uniref:Peptidase S8/S53 domain-containing protein n=1 Tax=Fusarium zealandicum TaxID=1053134 RepID=A0A8H4XPM8_9HYPO|nr:hypothetical protein FZEAL_614 [Fusarium zealandicum]
MPEKLRHVDLFFGTVHVFIASLPEAPDRNKPPGNNSTELALNNSVNDLRFEIRRLRDTFPKEAADVDSKEEHPNAETALEDIVYLLNSLVKDTVPGQETPDSEILRLNLPLRVDGLVKIPKEVKEYVCYAKPGSNKAVEYRRIAHLAQTSNNTMDRIFSPRATDLDEKGPQVFHADRNSEGNDSGRTDGKELYFAKRLSQTTKTVAQILSQSKCEKPHSAYIHLSGFEEPEVLTMMGVCGSIKKWRAVQWTSSRGHNNKTANLGAICNEMRKSHRLKTILHIAVDSDASWLPNVPPKLTTAIHTKPPTDTLRELIMPKNNENKKTGLKKSERLRIATKLGRSLFCLIGSPLLQESWKSDTIRCSEGDLFVLGMFPANPECRLAIADVTKSFILNFGVLLWELFFQGQVSIIKDDEDEDGDDASLFNALGRMLDDCQEGRFVDPPCLDIIGNCLTAWCDEEADEEKIRDNIHRKVICPLTRYWESYRPPAMNKTILLKDSPPGYPGIGNLMDSRASSSTLIHGNGRPLGPARSPPPGVQGAAQRIPNSEASGQPTEAALLASNGAITSSGLWIERFHQAHAKIAGPRQTTSPRAKVVILDTGCDMKDHYFESVGIDRVDDWQELWYDCLGESSEPVDEDPGRHGTAGACLLLQLAPNASVHVVRVSRDAYSLEKATQAIAQAITHSVKEWDVDVISMSFGFSGEIACIRRAIVEAERVKGDKILFIAAANNGGLNDPEMFPAFFESVISTRGTDHDGSFLTKYNPKSWSHKSGPQYGTLAQDVPYGWPLRNPTKSGCSIAAPILAAIALVIIAFVDAQDNLVNMRRLIRTRRGMTAVFDAMAGKQNQQQDRVYLAPWQLYENNRNPRIIIEVGELGYLERNIWLVEDRHEPSEQQELTGFAGAPPLVDIVILPQFLPNIGSG